MNHLKQGLALALASSFFMQTAFADGLLPQKDASKGSAEVAKHETPTTIEVQAVKKENLAPVIAPEAPELIKIAARDFDKYITVEKQAQPMDSKLTEMYSGYKVVINSEYPRTLLLKSATVTNMVTGSVASRVVRDNPWKGLLWLFVPYLGILLCPIMTIKYNVGNGKAKREATTYAGQAPTGSLRAGEPVQFFVIVPAGQTPSLTLKFTDKETDQDYILSSI